MRSLKILHVANRAEKKNANVFYSIWHKINNGLVRNNHNVLWFSDRDIARASGIIPAPKLGAKKCNRKLLEHCRNFRPDLLLLSHADLIGAETIRQVRAELPQLRVAQYNVDGLHIEHNLRMIRNKLDVVDMTFVTTAGPILRSVASDRAPAAFFPNPTDPSIEVHRCHERSDLPIDLFFAGQRCHFTDKEDLRNKVHDIAVHLPGRQVEIFESIWGANFVDRLGTARIGLNFSNRPEGTVRGSGSTLYFYSSDRISQYLGNGLLTIASAKHDLAQLYGADAVIEIDSFEELLDKVRFYLEHDDERRRIAANGYRIAHEEFNERLVTQYMLEAIFDKQPGHAYRWPTERYFPR